MRYLQRIIPTVFFGLFCIGIWLLLSGKITLFSSLPTSDTASASKASVEKIPITSFAENEKESHMAITPANIVWFSNYYRSQEGIRPLIQRKALNNSARAKNNHMLAHDYFAHTQPNTSTGFETFIDQQQYSFIKIGENLAMGDYTTSQEVVEAWMKSTSHRKNILDADYTEIGVHVASGIIHGKNVILITQHFGRPSKTCPAINENTQNMIGVLTKKIEQLRAEILIQQKELEGSGVQDTDSSIRIAEYNKLVDSYNTFVKNLQVMIDTYNEQVRAFEACAHDKK
jgi:uncharacterized protein YkwD